MQKIVTTLNFGELAGAPYSGSHSGGGSDSESEYQVKSLMELQQQGIPGYGLYGRHYGQQPGGQHDPGFRGPPMPGGYPFPPMPGQPNYGYSHLGYPSSQSPGPREGEESSLTSQSQSGAGASSACTSAAQIRATYPKVPFICNYTNFANYLFKLVEGYDTGNGGSEHTGYGKHKYEHIGCGKHAEHKCETHRTQIRLSQESPPIHSFF